MAAVLEQMYITVVDDEESIRKALTRLLQAVGGVVQVFATGREFLASLDLRHPACLILDLQLPDLPGLEIQACLVREKLAFPTIIITGQSDPGLDERVRAAGAAAFLRKPLNDQTLLDTIRSVTNGNNFWVEPASMAPVLPAGRLADETVVVED